MLSGQYKHVGVWGESGEGGIGDRAVRDYSKYKIGPIPLGISANNKVHKQ